jgi:hypothetical protein
MGSDPGRQLCNYADSGNQVRAIFRLMVGGSAGVVWSSRDLTLIRTCRMVVPFAGLCARCHFNDERRRSPVTPGGRKCNGLRAFPSSMAQRSRPGIAATGHQRGTLTGISAFQLASMETAPRAAAVTPCLGIAAEGDRAGMSRTDREAAGAGQVKVNWWCEIGQGSLAVAGTSGPLQQPLAAVEAIRRAT